MNRFPFKHVMLEEEYWDPEPRKARLAMILDRVASARSFHVIFICGGNICRSPFAEMRFEQLLKQSCKDTSSIKITSGGFISNKIIHEYTRKALLEAGVPEARIEGFSPRHMRKHKEEMVAVDLILVPTRGIIETLLPRKYHDKAFLLSEIHDGKQIDIEDPALLKDYGEYQDVMTRIEPYLEMLVDRFLEAGACKA